MKEIWINFELYYESYEFLIFRDFSRFILNFSEFLMNFLKINFSELKINFSNLNQYFGLRLARR